MTEAILIGVVLIVPLIWLLSALSTIHAASLATGAAARDASLLAAQPSDTSTARALARTAVLDALSNHDLDPEDVTVRIDMPPDMRRGGSVTVEVSYRVKVFAFPFLGEMGGPYIPVRATSVSRIEPYASRP